MNNPERKLWEKKEITIEPFACDCGDIIPADVVVLYADHWLAVCPACWQEWRLQLNDNVVTL